MNKLFRVFDRYLPVKKPKIKINLFIYFLVALVLTVNLPVLAVNHTIASPSLVKLAKSQNDLLIDQGKTLYDAGRFAEAVQVLQQAAQAYKQQGDRLKLAATLSNLSLAYQQLGDWQAAQTAIKNSLELLPAEKNQQTLQLLAQTLDIQGRLQLATGKIETALATWQQTAEIYQKINHPIGEVRSQINQAQAWRNQGFYRRAVQILLAVNQKLQAQPDSREKAVGLRSLGDALMVIGDLTQARTVLEQSLTIAQRLELPGEVGVSLLSLGNNARADSSRSKSLGNNTRAKQEATTAINYYQKIEPSASPLTQIQARLNQLSLLIDTQQLSEAQNLLTSIPPQLNQLPPSRAAIYAQINYAQSLMKLARGQRKDRGQGVEGRGRGINLTQSPVPNPQSPVPNPQSPIPNPQSPAMH
ncbi:hypothetical protein CV014_06705 [Nostoc sp. CMAA1605]|nr:hypothetical protein [Nostoc sp. CMAA1605]